MKKVMKKALGLVLALVMVVSLAPMSANAAPTAAPAGSGTAEDPYVLTTDGTTYGITLDANATVFVSTGNAYNSTINGVGSTGAYAFARGKNDYNPVLSSEDGTATITLEESNMVSLRNMEEDIIVVYLNATAGEGSAPVGTWDSPEIVTFVENEWRPGVFGANLQTELEAGNQGYYYQYTATEDGAVSVSVDAATDAEYTAPLGWMYQVTNKTKSIQTDMHYNDDEEVVYEEIMAVEAGDVLEVFVSTYDPANVWNCPAGVVFVNFGSLALGSSDYPESVDAGTYTADIKENVGEYYYIYKATESGKVSVTMNTQSGWAYSLYNLTSWAMTDYHTSGDEVIVATDGVAVAAGDEVKITIGTYDPNSFTPIAGTVDWTLSFVAGEVEDEEPDNGGNIEDEEPEEKEPYYQDTQTVLTLGEQYVILDAGYETTLFEFSPETAGTYTFTLSTEDAVIGYYGSNIWFPFNDETEKTNTVTVNYPVVGAPIIIGVSNTTMSALTIERTGDAKEEEKIPEQIYSVTATPYTFNGDASQLTYVDIEDANEDKAVLGKDGYYHLNTADGPILLVNLFEELLPLGNATATGKVAIALYEGDKLVGILNCNDALDLYVANSDKATGLYPLTEELMYIYKTYGEQQLWYTETGFVGGQIALGNVADAWMFACMYVPNGADGSTVVPPEQGDDNVIKEDVLDQMIEDAVQNNKPVVVPTTAPEVTMTFDVNDLKNAESVNLNIKVEVVADVKDETVAKNDKITADNFVLKVEFAHDGKLPAKATITIVVPKEEYANKTLYYYEILADGTLKYVCDAPVDANGNAKVTQEHCSDYVLLTEKLVEEIPDTGDTTNFVLWIAILGLGVAAMAGSVVMKKREF